MIWYTSVMTRKNSYIAAGLFVMIGVIAFVGYSQWKAQQDAAKLPQTPVPTATPVVTETPSITATPTPTVDPNPKLSGTCNTSLKLTIPVFMYHHVRPITNGMSKSDIDSSIDPKLFEAQLKEIQKLGYQTIFLSDIPKMLYGEIPIQKKVVALTFDDGYENFYTYAYPLLQKYQDKAEIFLIANFHGKKGTLTYLTEAEVKNMLPSGLIEVGSHTLWHPALQTLTETQQRSQIVGSKDALFASYQQPITMFNYPAGTYNAMTLKVVKAAGYWGAVTTKPGQYQTCATLDTMPRYRANYYSVDAIKSLFASFKQ